jgi:hypothetical protein
MPLTHLTACNSTDHQPTG